VSVAIAWLRDGLRLDDQPLLRDAAESCNRLIVVAFEDPAEAAPSGNGHPRIGTHRRAFRHASGVALNFALQALGQQLLWLRQDPVEGIVDLVRAHGAATIWTHAQPGSEERVQLDRLSRELPTGCALHVARDNRLFDCTPFGADDWPMSFSKFRRKVERGPGPGAPLPAPVVLPPPPKGPVDAGPAETPVPCSAGLFDGGEAAGCARLQHYLFESQHVLRYKQTRDGLTDFDDSTRLSPWLAHGCLSARRVWAEVERFERDVEANESTYWVRFELLWREYFRWLMDATGVALFLPAGLATRSPPSRLDPGRLTAWREARTGIPLVDAAMRELAATGFSSNRARQNVASFLVKDLGQDWRTGAAWFEYCLVDYDAASNWGNWAYQAGTGTDSRERWFNVVGQGQRHDPEGVYLARWLPELAALSPRSRHTPWTAAAPPSGYPAPIVLDPRWA